MCVFELAPGKCYLVPSNLEVISFCRHLWLKSSGVASAQVLVGAIAFALASRAALDDDSGVRFVSREKQQASHTASKDKPQGRISLIASFGSSRPSEVVL